MSSENRYDYIDALRGWAILGVLLVHVWIWIGAETDFLTRLASNGAKGVQLFYLVSTFTLLMSIERHRQIGGISWRDYFIRRFFRVAPLFYIAMAIYGPMWQFVPRYWMPEGIQGWHILTSLTFTHGWHPLSVNSIVPGGWSMAVEMTFYVLFPLLCLLITNVSRSVAFVVISLLIGITISKLAYNYYLPVVPERFSYVIKNFAFTYLPTAQICIFALGFVVFFLFKKEFFLRKSKQKGAIFICGGFLIILTLLYWSPPEIPSFFSFSVGFAILLIGLAFYPARVLVNPVINAIGKLSYSLYLTHFGVIFIFKTFLASYFQILNKDIALVLAFGLVVIASVLVSTLSYRLVEQPGIELGKKLIQRL